MDEVLINLFLTIVGSLLLYFLLPVLASVTLTYWICLLISAVVVFGGFLILTEGDFID